MSTVFRIELLPARHGDCILIEYGDAGKPKRILVDGGPIGAWDALKTRLERVPPDQREFELLVVTHIDADHIEGAIKLLNHPELATFQEIWFNGWPQLEQPLLEPEPGAQELSHAWRSVLQGQFLGLRIGKHSWNGAFDGDPVFVPRQGPLPRIDLPGDMRLTLLGPPLRALKLLKKDWDEALERQDKEVNEARIPAKYRTADGEQRVLDIVQSAEDATGQVDAAVANGSSIAFIAEHAGKRCAFLGDAHMPPTEDALRRYAREQRLVRVPLDVVKLAHHGSAANITPGFVDLVDCGSWLVSTDGSIFQHPDDAALRLVATRSPGARLFFNYRSERTAVWDEPELQLHLGHQAFYPAQAERGLVFDVLASSPA